MILLYMEINSKINNFINKYKNKFNTKTLNIIKESKDCPKNKELIQNYSRNLITNYKNKNQYVFNLIVSCTINKVINLLDENNFDNIVFEMNNNISDIYKRKYIKRLITLQEINEEYRLDYNKLIYILFFYLGIQRNIINILQKYNINKTYPSDYISKYGLLWENFFNEKNKKNEKYITHPLSMKRFDNYSDRVLYNIKCIEIKNINNNIVKIDKYSLYNESKYNIKKYDIRIYYKINNIGLLNKINTKNLSESSQIDSSLFSGEQSSKKNTTDINDNFYLIISLIVIDDIKINNNVSSIGNFFNSSKYKFYLLNILSFYLHKLNDKKNNIINNKEYIIKFYYTLIFLMPFQLGTASISEIMLFSLWKKYIGYDLILNKKIMLDVEALTLPFDIFYINCITSTENDGYTPYFLSSFALQKIAKNLH